MPFPSASRSSHLRNAAVTSSGRSHVDRCPQPSRTTSSAPGCRPPSPRHFQRRDRVVAAAQHQRGQRHRVQVRATVGARDDRLLLPPERLLQPSRRPIASKRAAQRAVVLPSRGDHHLPQHVQRGLQAALLGQREQRPPPRRLLGAVRPGAGVEQGHPASPAPAPAGAPPRRRSRRATGRPARSAPGPAPARPAPSRPRSRSGRGRRRGPRRCPPSAADLLGPQVLVAQQPGHEQQRLHVSPHAAAPPAGAAGWRGRAPAGR